MAILRRVISEPTAPFHEFRVRDALRAVLQEAGLSTRIDPYGNLTAIYKRGKAAPLTLMAHMDHPGFEIVSVTGSQAEARWNGQVPPFNLKGLRLVLLAGDDGAKRGTAIVLRGDGRKPRKAARSLLLRVPKGARAGDFGHAHLTPFRLSGHRVISKAHDNVTGCAAIAAALAHLARHKLPGDVCALFTRGEEEGFQGAFGAIRNATVSKSRPIVILECSKEMPGAEMGKGPVIRVGDRMRVFDADLVTACAQTARKLAAIRKSFRYQRRLMDGGVCEASMFGLAGYRTVGFAFPLGNYHNVGARKVEPEYIDRRDFFHGVDCLAAFATLGVDPRKSRRALVAWTRKAFGPKQRARLTRSARR